MDVRLVSGVVARGAGGVSVVEECAAAHSSLRSPKFTDMREHQRRRLPSNSKTKIQKSGAWLPNVSPNHESRNARKTPNQTPPFLMHLFLVSWLSNNPTQSSRTKPTRAAPGPPFMAVDLRAHLRGGEEGIFAPVHRRAGGMARPGRKNVIECRSTLKVRPSGRSCSSPVSARSSFSSATVRFASLNLTEN